MQGQVCIYVPASGCFLSNHPVSHKGNCCTCNRILELRGAFEHWMHQNANAENRLLVVGNNDQARKMISMGLEFGRALPPLPSKASMLALVLSLHARFHPLAS